MHFRLSLVGAFTIALSGWFRRKVPPTDVLDYWLVVGADVR